MFSFANISTAKTPLASVAVVITGTAPILHDNWLHHSFAPPRCPERRDIRNLPCSSATNTAGSVTLLFMYGARVLTAIAAAHINSILSQFINCSRITLPTESNDMTLS